MKLNYNVATHQVTLDATPQEIAELAPSALERALSSIVKIVGKIVDPLVPDRGAKVAETWK